MSYMPGQAARETGVYRDRNSTADRALDILQLFTDDKLVWSGAEIAERIGVARSTGYRYIKGLVGSGFIEECDGGFRLGPQVFELARLARKGVGLSEIARPIMRELADAVGETVLLTRRSGSAVVCLELEECANPVRLSYERGHVLPINAGASAQVLLAWASPDDVAEVLASTRFEKFTERTLTGDKELRERLDQIRADGYAIARGELDAGVLGIGAPVHLPNGAVAAAVSIAALEFRIPEAEEGRIVEAVREAADRISARLQQIEA
jgi:DNA-binding IclR family transcriptional regulator